MFLLKSGCFCFGVIDVKNWNVFMVDFCFDEYVGLLHTSFVEFCLKSIFLDIKIDYARLHFRPICLEYFFSKPLSWANLWWWVTFFGFNRRMFPTFASILLVCVILMGNWYHRNWEISMTNDVDSYYCVPVVIGLCVCVYVYIFFVFWFSVTIFMDVVNLLDLEFYL